MKLKVISKCVMMRKCSETISETPTLERASSSTQLSGATFGLASSKMGVVRAQIRFRSDISPLESVGRSFPARLTDPLVTHPLVTHYNPLVSTYPRVKVSNPQINHWNAKMN